MYVIETLGYFHMNNIVLNYYKCVVAIVVSMYFIACNCNHSWVKRFLELSDKYSYSVYLVHHIFILGSLSVMTLTPYLLINIAIAATVIAGFVLCILSDTTTKLLIR